MAYVAPSLSNDVVLLAKQESAIGTEAVPAGTDALLIDNAMTPNQQDVKMIDTAPVRTSFSKRSSIVGRSIANLSFDAFLQGSGASGGVKPWFVFLLEACGLSAGYGSTSGSSASWVLTPTNTPASVTFHHYAAQVRQKITGCFGNCKFTFPAGDAVKMNFTFGGTWVQPETGQSAPTLTYPTFLPKMAETESLTLTPAGSGAYTPIAASVALDLGVENREREDLNASKGFYGFFAGNRNPMVDLVIEREKVLTNFDPYTLMQNAILVGVAWTHGSAASGSQAYFSLPYCQIVQANEQDGNGRKQWNLRLKPVSDTTENGDLTITFKQKL